MIDLTNGKNLSASFPFQFSDDIREWEQYANAYPAVVAKAVGHTESRFKGGKTVEVFEKAIEYVKRSLKRRPYQYWMAHRLIALLNAEGKGRVLDYGCGAGNMGVIFAHAGFLVNFADVKGVITDFVSWRVGKHFLKSVVYTHEADLGEEQYDLICMQNVMEHLDDPLEVLKKLTKALSKGGYFLITCNTSGKGLDVVSQETIDTVLTPYLLANFIVVENTDNMLFKKYENINTDNNN